MGREYVHRGKDAPIKALESALKDAKEKLARNEDEIRRAKYVYEETLRARAIQRRNIRDIERSIEVVRALKTEPLAEYIKQSEADDPIDKELK